MEQEIKDMMDRIEKKVDEILAEIEDLRGVDKVSLEDLVVKLDNVSLPGGDFEVGEY